METDRLVDFEFVKKAKPADLITDKRKITEKSKKEEMEYYRIHHDFLVQKEINRLKNNAERTRVVADFDCGLCAKCRVKDRSVCDDGYNCKKKQGRLINAETIV